MPHAYVIAGPNGAGKTTFARDYLPLEVDCFEFINNDLIAAGLAPLKPELAQGRAARIVLSQLRDMVKQRRDFGFETTLAGRTYATMISDWKAHGYSIHLYYIWLPDVNLHIQRVADRVRQGGHDVPVEDIQRRYQRSLVNFFALYRPLATTWTIINNVNNKSNLVARYNDQGEVTVDAVFLQLMRERYREYTSQAS